MRVRSFLRDIRERRGASLTDVSLITGLARGEISMFERGHSIPRAPQIAVMTQFYGPLDGWYPRSVFAALHHDIRECPGCGDELHPDAPVTKVYHGEACRSRHRRAIANGAA